MSKGLQDTVYLQNNIKEAKRGNKQENISRNISEVFLSLINWGKKRRPSFVLEFKKYLAGFFQSRDKVRQLKITAFQKSNVRIVEVLRFKYELSS